MSSSTTASPAWRGASAERRCNRPPRKALEIVGVVFAFIWFWPLAVAYLVWKCLGYPVPNEIRSFFEKNFTTYSFSNAGWGSERPVYRSTGNAAFEDYRRSELARLEEERRRLDEESRAFAEFVEELKRAKDREEFDAFMARRRSGPTGSDSPTESA